MKNGGIPPVHKNMKDGMKLKLEKNKEVMNTISEISENVLKYSKNILKKIEYQKTTDELVSVLENVYKSFDLNLKVRHDVSSFYDIPYNQKIKLNQIKKFKNIKLEKNILKKDTLIMLDYPKMDCVLNHYVHYGSYNNDVVSFKLTEGGNVYMSPTEMEYNTMKKYIDRAWGNVLTFGLGIGFYQYMALLKDDVKSVTVVEKNPSTIKLFKEYILPQFDIAKKIEIIQGDAFDYATEEFINKFDYTFIDIHFNNNDGADFYEKFIKKGVDFNKVGFWIQEQILNETKMIVASYLLNLSRGTLTECLLKEGSMQKDFRAVHKAFREESVVIDTRAKVLYYINNHDFIRKVLKFK